MGSRAARGVAVLVGSVLVAGLATPASSALAEDPPPTVPVEDPPPVTADDTPPSTVPVEGSPPVTAELPPPEAPPPSRPAPVEESPAEAVPTVGVVGDSLPGRGRRPITAALHHDLVFWRVVAGSRVADHLEPTLAAVQAPDGPDILIVIVGHAQATVSSPAAWDRQTRRFLNRVGPHVDCIRWFDLQTNRSIYGGVNRHARAYNAITHRFGDRHPNVDYVHYADWRRRVGHRFIGEDLLHLTEQGHEELALMVQRAADGCDPARTSGPFWDVPDHHPAAPAVAWAGAAGVSGGFDNGTYRPEIGTRTVAATRSQAVAMLWRAVGRPRRVAPHGWPDAPAWMNPALRWGRAEDVVRGIGDRFRGGDDVTRGQMLAMLWRAAGQPTGFPAHPWPASPPRLDGALRWAAHDPDGAGPQVALSDGIVEDALGHTRALPRAELARLLHRFVAPEAGIP